MSGKGSTPRPFSVGRQEFSDSWDRIFGQRTRGSIEHRDDVPKDISSVPTDRGSEGSTEGCDKPNEEARD